MNDLNYSATGLGQFASGSITYGVPVAGVKATGVVTVVDYLKAILTAATQTLTVSGAITPGSHAVSTLTSTGVNVGDNDNININGRNYIFKVTLSGAADEIFIGAAASDTLDNIKAAINHSAGEGTLYGTGTVANTLVVATTKTATTLDIIARVPGTAANAYTTTTASGGKLSWTGATLAGGVAGETVTIDGRTYTFVDALSETSGAAAIVDQVLRGADTAAALDNLKSAINASAGAGTTYSTGTTAHATTNATTNTDTTQVIAADTAGSAGNSIAVSEALANGAWGASTLAGGYNNLTVTVNGTALVQGSDFTASVDNGTTATSLASAIAALANITAAAVGAVITITADAEGTTANAYTMVTSSAPAATVSGATMSGGVNGDTVIVDGNTFTCVTSSPGSGEFTNITELEALVEAVAGVNSSVSGGVITVQANAGGIAGNAITLAVGVSNAGTMSVSGATLSGGVASTTTSYLQLDEEAEVIKAFIQTANLTSGATLTITPQTSIDASDWQDLPTIVITANGDVTEEISDLLTFNRLKIVVNDGSATSPTADLTIKLIPSQADTEREHDFAIPSALAASGVVKTSGGKFYGITGYIDETAPTADLFLYVYDAVAVPANGALSATLLLMPPLKINQASGLDTEFSYDYGGKFKRATNGIVWFLSTTGGLTKTLAGAYAMPTVETE